MKIVREIYRYGIRKHNPEAKETLRNKDGGMVPVERLIHGQVCNRCGGYRGPKRTPLLHRWRMMLISLSIRNPSFLLLLIALRALSLITQHYPPVDRVRVQVPVCWKVDSTWSGFGFNRRKPSPVDELPKVVSTDYRIIRY